MAFDKYRHYFDIDPDYFPAVNEAVINNNPDMWKKYYPHATFIKLVKDTVSVLRKEQKRSIWVEGAYGTGKSHAVLTLKKLLDASEEETKYIDMVLPLFVVTTISCLLFRKALKKLLKTKA